MFDPARHVVGRSRRDARRIESIGLGNLDFCPVVRKTPALLELLDQDILGQSEAFAEAVGPSMLERALTWAYLSETEGSFAIEGEEPTHDKAATFAALLPTTDIQLFRLTEGRATELPVSAATLESRLE